MNYAIVGIHTGIGKTVCSALLCEALGYDYWKPVQAGELDNTDSMFIKANVGNPKCNVHPELYALKTAASPHHAASLENIQIRKSDFELPKTNNSLVVETAGGLMSPLATNFLNIDLIDHLQLPVILVSHNYLGSINHTLLTFSALKERNIPTSGIIFIGTATPPTENIILARTGLKHILSIPLLENLNSEAIKKFASGICINLG